MVTWAPDDTLRVRVFVSNKANRLAVDHQHGVSNGLIFG